jgi:RNA polymerase sigma-70 factor (ECF subfamily)
MKKARSHSPPADLETFNRLVLQFQDMVYRQAIYLLGDPQAAEDAAQETFISAWRHYGDQRGGSLKAWLLRIVSNKCYDEIRRRKRQPQSDLEPLNEQGEAMESAYWMEERGEPLEKQVENSELRHILTQYLNLLPDERQTAVILVDLQELNYAEAAQVLGISLGTLKSRLARARRQLRGLMLLNGGNEMQELINCPPELAYLDGT